MNIDELFAADVERVRSVVLLSVSIRTSDGTEEIDVLGSQQVLETVRQKIPSIPVGARALPACPSLSMLHACRVQEKARITFGEDEILWDATFDDIGCQDGATLAVHGPVQTPLMCMSRLITSESLLRCCAG